MTHLTACNHPAACSLLTAFIAICIVACPAARGEGAGSPVHFKEVKGVIPLEARSRRKWDNPLIADLDQDGWLDLVLTDHSYRARVYWNDRGKFSKPTVVVKGDTHGVTTGDYDHDGRMELIFSQGGGGGDKPRNPVWFEVANDREVVRGGDFSHFERSRGRAAKLIDGDNNGSLDLLLTAFPLRTQADGANYVYRNDSTGKFELASHLPQAAWMGFRALATDFNGDGDTDILLYGGDNMVAVRGESGLAYTDVTGEVLAHLRHTTFVSSISEIDYDNDGDFDLFLTRADHPFERETYYDPKGRRFAFFARNEEFLFDDLTIDGDFKLENLQMAFPHFDVFVGSDKRQLSFDVDRHGDKSFSLAPDEAQGWPDDRSAPGLYIGHVGDGKWRIGGETKSPTAAVIHNVTSQPTVTQPMELPAKLFENRDGVFTDVTSKLGIYIGEPTTSAAVGDFDNDGWSDLFVVRYGDPSQPTKQILYLNHGGTSFNRAEDHGIVSAELGSTGGGAEAFDYDQDGDLDLVYCNERGRWHLATNQARRSDKSNYVVVKVGGSPSGKATSLGAQLTIVAGDQTYRRVVGSSSAAFSQSADNHLHVGLGDTTEVDEAFVRWTSGEQAGVDIDQVNKAYSVGQFRDLGQSSPGPTSSEGR